MEGRLGSVITTGSGQFHVYTAPSDTYVKLNVAVTSTAVAVVKLYISPDNTPAAIDLIQLDKLRQTGTYGYERTAIILSPDEQVWIEADIAGVSCNVYGTEFKVSTETSGKLNSSNISTATSTSIYTTPSNKTAAVNVSVVMNSLSDSCDVELYLADTGTEDAAELIQKETLNTILTGFERSGIMLTENQRLILKTANVVGAVSTRVHGFQREKRVV